MGQFVATVITSLGRYPTGRVKNGASSKSSAETFHCRPTFNYFISRSLQKLRFLICQL